MLEKEFQNGSIRCLKDKPAFSPLFLRDPKSYDGKMPDFPVLERTVSYAWDC